MKKKTRIFRCEGAQQADWIIQVDKLAQILYVESSTEPKVRRRIPLGKIVEVRVEGQSVGLSSGFYMK